MAENSQKIMEETKMKNSKIIANFIYTNFRDGHYDTDVGNYEITISNNVTSIYEALQANDLKENFRKEILSIKRKIGEDEILNSDKEKIRVLRVLSKNQQTANLLLGTQGFYDAIYNISDIEPNIVENFKKFIDYLAPNQRVALAFNEEEWSKIDSTFISP